MDVGAEYANYSSDMTRTIPVNGRFTRLPRLSLLKTISKRTTFRK